MDANYYITYDLAVPYRNMIIHPVIVKDYFLFNTFAQCLMVEKNTIPDVKIISMTDLEYVYHATETCGGETPHLVWFDRLLSLVLRDDDSFKEVAESMKRYKYDEKRKPFFVIKNERYSSKDFDTIKKIICQQNMIELPDERISKEVRDSLEEAKRYKRSLKGTKPTSLEDYITSLSMVTGWTPEYIYSMTIRRFIKSIRRLDNFIHYKIYLAASMSGMVEFKDKSFIKHWLSNIDDEDIYEGATIDLDTMKDTISLESAKK